MTERVASDDRSSEGPTAHSIEISIFSIMSALLRWRKRIAIYAVGGAALGLSYGLLSTRQYVSAVSFIPQTSNDQSATGGLALAASQFGIRMPNSGGGWGPPIYAELLQSRGLLEQIALDTLIVVEEGNKRVPVMELLKVKETVPAERLEKGISLLRTVIQASEDKKLGAVRVVVKTKWPSVSFALSQKVVASMNTFNLKSRQSQARAEREFVEGQAQEAERALRKAEDRMQDFLQSNRVIASPALKYENDRLQRDITLRQQAYTSLLQSHAEARIREVRDTPVITVLEAPALPAVGEARHSIQKALMGGMLGVMLAFMLEVLAVARASNNERAGEFFDLLDSITPAFLRRRQQG